MKRVYPNYYRNFSCIGGACRHSCCVGWEIDVDADTLSYYEQIGGELGERLRESISYEGAPHFVLGEGERCPFLNKEGLCDLILSLGEDALCDICSEHPRFHNEFAGRLESGLGLCCEAAARLILAEKEPMTLVTVGETDADECDPATERRLLMRDRVIKAYQRREQWLPGRTVEAQRISGATTDHLVHRTRVEWLALLASLEPLDPVWTRLLGFTRRTLPSLSETDFRAFDAHMETRQTEYEQFFVYWLYRYFGNAETPAEMGTELLLAGTLYDLLTVFGTAIHRATGDFTFDQQVGLVRLLSSEIEYSEENLAALRAYPEGK